MNCLLHYVRPAEIGKNGTLFHRTYSVENESRSSRERNLLACSLCENSSQKEINKMHLRGFALINNFADYLITPHIETFYSEMQWS